jgi:hypothetical protein
MDKNGMFRTIQWWKCKNKKQEFDQQRLSIQKKYIAKEK